MRKVVKIGTRCSKMAMKQTSIVVAKLKKADRKRKYKFQIIPIKLSKDVSGAKENHLGVKGMFTKGIHEMMIENKIDLAVHSLKDLPSETIDKFEIVANLKRQYCEDGFFSNKYKCFADISDNARIGTSSLRRAALVKKLKPNAEIVEIRGNIDTRLSKIDEMNLDGIIISHCGPRLINVQKLVKYSEKLDITRFIPSPGQGVVVVDCLKTNQDKCLLDMLSSISDDRFDAIYERKLARMLNADCHSVFGCNVKIVNNIAKIAIFYQNPLTLKVFHEYLSCQIDEIDDFLHKVANVLLA